MSPRVPARRPGVSAGRWLSGHLIPVVVLLGGATILAISNPFAAAPAASAAVTSQPVVIGEPVVGWDVADALTAVTVARGTPTAVAPKPSLSPSPPPTSPSPTLGSTPGVGTEADADEGSDGPGFLDVTGRVKEAIDGWLGGLVESALNPVLELLASTVLATPDLTGEPQVQQLWTGCQVAANSLFVLFVVAGGVLLMSHETVQSRYAVKEIAPRLVIGIIAANLSMEIVGRFIGLANALSVAVTGAGVDPRGSGERLRQILVHDAVTHGQFMILLSLAAAVLALIVALTYVARVAVTILLLIAAPLFLICHASPATEGVAIFWWRAMAGCFAVQVIQALTWITALRLFLTPDGLNVLGLPDSSTGLINLLVVICLLWILARIPTWVARTVFQPGRSRVAGMVRTVMIVKGLKAVGLMAGPAGTAGAAAATAGAARAASRRRPPGGIPARPRSQPPDPGRGTATPRT